MSNVPYLWVNILALCCYTVLFVVFLAAKKTPEIQSMIMVLGGFFLWTSGSVMMRLRVYPGVDFWFYVSIMSLFALADLLYIFVCNFTREKGYLLRIIWSIGTAVMLGFTATGIFLKPPVVKTLADGDLVFEYTMDGKIIIPLVFIMCIVASIAKVFVDVIRRKGIHTPGVMSILAGCVTVAVGNIMQILPGNVFPWDTLSGIIFAGFLSFALYRKRMFRVDLLISRGLLTVIIGSMFLFASSNLILPFYELLIGKYKLNTATSLMIMCFTTAVVFMVVYQVAKSILDALAMKGHENHRFIQDFSKEVSRSLNIELTLKLLGDAILRDVPVRQIFICLKKGGEYHLRYCSNPLNAEEFSLRGDHPCIEYINNQKEITEETCIRFEDFRVSPLYNSMWQEERQLFEKLNIKALALLMNQDEVIGVMLLSAKEKSNRYANYEMEYIETACSIATISIRNCILYENSYNQEQLFKKMSEYIPTVILIRDKEKGSYEFVSANTMDILGVSSEEIEKKGPTFLPSHFGSEITEEIDTFLQKYPTRTFYKEFRFEKLSTDETWYSIYVTPVFFDNIVTHYVALIRDVTEEKMSKELLTKAMNSAESANHAKSDFLSHMSHEIRTPMNAIIGMTNIAMDKAQESGDPEMIRSLGQIDLAAKFLLAELNDIMDISRIESGKFVIQHERFDLVEALESTAQIYEEQTREKGLSFKYEAKGMEHRFLIGDVLILRKVLNNLLSNSYKYTKSGMVRFTAEQHMRKDNIAVMTFTIEDTGIGMTQEFLKHLFDPFIQESAKNSGSGLGMAICKNLVDMMNGTITVTSQKDVGSKFVVDIAFEIAKEENEEIVHKKETDLSILKGRRILVVEDVEINAEIAAKLLEKQGMLPDVAENGKVAVDYFLNRPVGYYDCILMDIQMPVMNGLEAADAIRSLSKSDSTTVPILAMTADAFSDDVRKSFEHGMNDHLTKPIDPRVLYRSIAYWVAKKDAQAESIA
ncbi:MAG TPA: ATP-binding protein [Oscillospiraceae bacterium]|nr:ATP-binding protein [Oscillospiraceae bacterium]HRW57219.1 ATP-binding protein [Oscillospiraceae bacterium]